MQKTLGGDRLGSGKKMKVNMHGFDRSTHDLGYLWRSTMASGTLVPFMSKVALPGDTFDIVLDVNVKTHPTVGPLFGSEKVQLDIFQCPIRLYNGELHNNKLGIGLHMAEVTLPQLTLEVNPDTMPDFTSDIDMDRDNAQINSSCILNYLGIKGIGIVDENETGILTQRDFNAVPYLSYVDIYKNYYANKQEEIGYVIHRGLPAVTATSFNNVEVNGETILQSPAQTYVPVTAYDQQIIADYTGGTLPHLQLVFNTNKGQFFLTDIATNLQDSGTVITATWNLSVTGTVVVHSWGYVNNNNAIGAPIPVSFPLADIDQMREEILRMTGSNFNVTQIANDESLEPYNMLLQPTSMHYKNTQEGLLLKTYQSDLYNNWLSTEWIDGVGGINEITAIDTSGGSFNIDTLNLSKKVYDMLNRIAVSGGSYDDWLDVNWDHPRFLRAETPIYHGGLIRELVFQEVVSNSEATGTDQTIQPLGTLAGKGVMADKKKGGYVTIKVDEPSYIIGIVSITPRIDYSQGNEWDTQLKTMDDLHKPALDEIGFQELIMEGMAWWSTFRVLGAPTWTQRSAGKQPAWLNYMTSVNKTYGNFAISTNEMFMTLNRRYEYGVGGITDLTTYIDPSKFNHIFAQTSIDAQNFWTQISVDITARRKMSAKIMPNL